MRKTPQLTLILLDWSVRESFHLLHYLRGQSVDREQFEVVLIEYYSRIAEPLKQFTDQIDTWILLEMPESCIYHKHLMYNCGLAFARGDVVVLCDSDAMVKKSFVETIIAHFKERSGTVLHLDQFRNMRRDLYPFNYPSFEEVLGDGCVNNREGETSGIVDRIDPLHSRNYGACMCARRTDLITIGGADEHSDYLGHICGPYEMTFRLLNNGFKEVWHETEYLYHTWHPGQAGVDNYQAPHDGRQMSRTALEILITGRVCPLVENNAIGLLRRSETLIETSTKSHLVRKRYLREWDRSRVTAQHNVVRHNSFEASTDMHRGFKILKDQENYYARTLLNLRSGRTIDNTSAVILKGKTLEELIDKIDEHYPSFLCWNERINDLYSRLSMLMWAMAVPLMAILNRICVGARQKDYNYRRFVIAPGVSSSHLFSQLWHYWEKYKIGWLATKHYRAYMERCANHLITNLYFAEARVQLPVVLTTSPYLQIYLWSLAGLGIIPAIKIRRVKKAETERYFEQLSRGDHRQYLIVTRDIFTNYYGLIKTSSHLTEFLIF